MGLLGLRVHGILDRMAKNSLSDEGHTGAAGAGSLVQEARGAVDLGREGWRF